MPLLGGSAARGRAAPTSDLDVVVLLPDGNTSRREVVRHEDLADSSPGDRYERLSLADFTLREAANLSAAEEVLDLLGGPLREGYTQRWQA